MRVQAIRLERKVDSLSHLVASGQQQAERISALIAGKDIRTRDTAMLKPELLKALPESILPDPQEIKEQATVVPKKEKRNARKRR
jgi:hypothetical protein